MSETPRSDRLREIHLLADLPDSDLEALACSLSWMRTRANQVVAGHLEHSNQVCFVLEGELQLRILGPDNRRLILRHLHPGAHFGELAALSEAPRSLEVFAVTPGLIAICAAEDFLSLLASSPVFALATMRMLARRIIVLTDRLYEHSRLEVRFRINAELLRLSRGGVAHADGIHINGAPTHENIAASIGAQREAVTRELSYLAQVGILSARKGVIIIHELERLKGLLERRRGPAASDDFDASNF